MASVGLPSTGLWRGMQSRANALPLLMHEAVQDDSAAACHRVRACLRQLAALACFVRAARFSLYCRECNKLLVLYRKQDTRRALLGPLLLGAAVRVAQSLASPMLCTIDNADLNELRQAHGASCVDRMPSLSSAAWAVPRLQALLLKQLMRAHYTLSDASNKTVCGIGSAQPNSFLNVNRVAALWLGEVLLESVNNCANIQQTCLQILRLELCCYRVSGGRPATTFSAMQEQFLEVSMQKCLRGLRKEIRALLQQAEQEGGIRLERSLLTLHRMSACCALLDSRYVQAVAKLSLSAQRLVLHLRCWDASEREASTLLCLWLLTLERHLDIALTMLQQRRTAARTDLRIGRKIEHFIRTRRRRLRAAYAVPVNSARALCCKELEDIHHRFLHSLGCYRQGRVITLIEDDFFHALIRFKAISLYMGELALYELLCNLRELVVLAIERKLLLPKTLIALLPRLTAYSLRSFKQERRVLGYDTQLIGRLSETLRTQRQVALLKIDWRDNRISLPARNGQSKKRDKHSITTTQLPSFLAQNIRGLATDPQAIYRCQSAQEFAQLSRGLILELSLLARGARALQVDRVAALSEVLLEIYRALNALSELPEPDVLERNLQGAHRCLRLALNQAAARQKVCDVSPTVVSLYHFLECLHRAPAQAPDSLQAILGAVNALLADMRAFADVFAALSSDGHGGRYQLAQELLQGLISRSRCIQEDVSANAMIGVARWGPSLMVEVGRYSNERGKSARLEFFLDEVAAPRGVVEQFQVPLRNLLCLIIEHSVEGVVQRRAAGKPDNAFLRLRATRSGATLNVCVEDDGTGLTASQVASVTEQIGALGGTLSLAGRCASGNLVRVTIP